MSLTIELSTPAERKLAERAAREGKSAAVLAAEMIESSLDRGGSFDANLAPFRQEFAESGLTEAEWDAMIEQARDEVWQERHGGKR